MAMNYPPLPPDEYDRERVEHSRFRRRLLLGEWREDLYRALRTEIDSTRRIAWGAGDITKNVFRSVVNQLSVLYDREPVIDHERGEGAVTTLRDVVQRAGLWQLAPRMQQFCVGMREALYRFDMVPGSREDGAPSIGVRIVASDLVYGVANPDEQDIPIKICEYRRRTLPDGSEDWFIDEFSIEDPDRPYYRVIEAKTTQLEDGTTYNRDFSEMYLGKRGGLEGEAYPYRYADGTPFLPYSLYHASRTGTLFDPYFGLELCEGSLVVSVLWTFWRHCVRDCSWPQRYAVGVRPAGGYTSVNTQGNYAYIPTDPASLLNFETTTDAAPVLGQFAAGSDPTKLGDAIRQYASDLALDFGISSTDMARVSANPRSGYAIALSKEGVRGAQRRAKPQFYRGDTDTLNKISALWNRLTGDNLPENGWTIHYPGVPLSTDEKRLQMEEYEKQAALGVASPVDLYMRIHNVTRGSAEEALRKIAEERRQYAL